MTEHRIVLTGASGMLGRAILKELAQRSDVVTLALYRSKSPEGLSNKIENRVIDLFQSDELNRTLGAFGPTALVHTAATGMQQPLPDAPTLLRINVELPAILAGAASTIPGCHFVHVSSGLAYKDQGRPLREDDPLETIHPYGTSKVEAEKRLQTLAQDRGVPLTIVRPFSFTGEGDLGSRLFPSLLRSAVEKRPFEMSTGKQVRDHSSVNDIARGVIAATLQSRPESVTRIFNFGSGDMRPLRDLVRSVINELGLAIDLRLGAKSTPPYEPMFAWQVGNAKSLAQTGCFVSWLFCIDDKNFVTWSEFTNHILQNGKHLA